ncbi:hypothetical protein CTI12_AA412530 [Artemisia annua]|uniref:Uncharacterized protein n=1 Tax=Artemisia annua TaxID=35608 RepID=A0A2U1M754_ARTAN|nr:hypothetical protein CTI12_AA412530 [Artemisia annua]
MGCGMSRSNLMDEGMAAFGARLTLHHKPNSEPPMLLNNETSIFHEPPVLQKINTVDVNHGDHDNSDGEPPMWLGSPSFREYVQFVPDDDHVATKGAVTVIGIHGGENLTCNRKDCIWEDSKGMDQEDKKDTRGGRFRKVFHVQRATFWPTDASHVGHAKATRKVA